MCEIEIRQDAEQSRTVYLPNTTFGPEGKITAEVLSTGLAIGVSGIIVQAEGLTEAEQATKIDAAVESDDRVRAWHVIVAHPFFARAFEMEGPLIESMVEMLDFEMGRTDLATAAEPEKEDRAMRAPVNDTHLRQLAMDFAVRTFNPATDRMVAPEQVLAFLKGESKSDTPAPDRVEEIQIVKREAYQEVVNFLDSRKYYGGANITRSYFLSGGEG